MVGPVSKSICTLLQAVQGKRSPVRLPVPPSFVGPGLLPLKSLPFPAKTARAWGSWGHH